MGTDPCPGCNGTGFTQLGNQLHRCILCAGGGLAAPPEPDPKPIVDAPDGVRLTAIEAHTIASDRKSRNHHESYERAWKRVAECAREGYMSCNLRFSTPEARDRFIAEASSDGFVIRQTDGLVVCSWSRVRYDGRRNQNNLVVGRFPLSAKD